MTSHIDETTKQDLNMTCKHPRELAQMEVCNKDALNIRICVVFTIVQDGGSSYSLKKSRPKYAKLENHQKKKKKKSKIVSLSG